MHPNVKTKILLGLKSLIILITVTNLISATPFCPRGEIRSAIMTLYPSNRPLRIENRKVIAMRPDTDNNSLLFIKFEGLDLLLYDPRAMHFICFNPKRTKLMAKRNPLKSKIDQCLFREEASRKWQHTLRNYVNQYKNRSVMITIGHNGLYFDKTTRKCIKKSKRPKRNCMDSDFLISSCKDGKTEFCNRVMDVRKSRGIIHDLKTRYCENT